MAVHSVSPMAAARDYLTAVSMAPTMAAWLACSKAELMGLWKAA